jgi:hypothetical protein
MTAHFHSDFDFVVDSLDVRVADAEIDRRYDVFAGLRVVANINRANS